jgi:hypothetical protein
MAMPLVVIAAVTIAIGLIAVGVLFFTVVDYPDGAINWCAETSHILNKP